MVNKKIEIKKQSEESVIKSIAENPEHVFSLISEVALLKKENVIRMASRIAQSYVAGSFFNQINKELTELINKGKIDKNKIRFDSLADLLNFIDAEVLDVDKFEAIKSMFYLINLNNSIDEKEQFINYQLFNITKELSSSQLLTLKSIYNLHKNKFFDSRSVVSASEWLTAVAAESGHNLRSLIDSDEGILIDKKLITSRTFSDKSGVSKENARLTDLGLKLCKNLERGNYNNILIN